MSPDDDCKYLPANVDFVMSSLTPPFFVHLANTLPKYQSVTLDMLDEPSKIPNLSFFQKAKNKNKSVSQNRMKHAKRLLLWYYSTRGSVG
jgi:hypothetical protein